VVTPPFVPVSDTTFGFQSFGGRHHHLSAFAPAPFLPFIPHVVVPIPVPVPIIVPQPVVVFVPVFLPPPPPHLESRLVPAPCLVPTPELLPAPIPIITTGLMPATCLTLVPVLVPGGDLGFYPPLLSNVLPALGQVYPPTFFGDTPLQVLPIADQQYALVHPDLYCGIDAASDCLDAADQLNAITPGFGTTEMDGPDGYGMYLTYTADDDFDDGDS